MLPKPSEILPQQPPFLFVDEYLELDENHCLAKYTFKGNEWFFKGHFPGNPVVPGVVLIEAMAQVGVVSIGIFDLAKRKNLPLEKVKEERIALFTHVGEIEFLETVKPEETIFISCQQNFKRFNKIETGGEIYKIVNGQKRTICTHKSLTGQGVKTTGG
jgi:3-hydroxyacyl-[acyl-carrier-protein] dehydratase